MSSKAIIFDLDGTLIDSADAILSGLQAAANEADYSLNLSLEKALIGPPLRMTLQKLTGVKDDLVLDRMIATFKSCYDTVGYKKTLAFSGVDSLLRQLHSTDQILMLATNKRMIPTVNILKHFGWLSLFHSIYAIDKNPLKVFSNKSEMLYSLIKENGIELDGSLYIGDRIEDQESAAANGLKAITVTWGYGDYQDPSIYSQMVSSIDELSQALLLNS